MHTTFLRQIGVYGFNDIEPLILASLVSEDPILLIGLSGTGKTYLLNRVSEALELNHKHYNASLISFDDLIGFPFPNQEKKAIDYLPTPASIWEAESVLIDEISRCKPEVQNKFFSIVHEKRIQGIALEKLRYRWAAMNPVNASDGFDDDYSGSQALDTALADRFAFILPVPDWHALSEADQTAVVSADSNHTHVNDTGALRRFVEKARPIFLQQLNMPNPEIILYARLVTNHLQVANIRLSPRRARLLVRNLVALFSVLAAEATPLNEQAKNTLFKLVLFNSIPHRAYQFTLQEHLLEAAHAEAMRMLKQNTPDEQWLSSFLNEKRVLRKIEKLLTGIAGKEIKSLGITQWFKKENKVNKALFSFILFPFLLEHRILNEEALNLIAHIAQKMMVIDGTIDWKQSPNNPNRKHPQWGKYLEFIQTLSNDIPRQQRAKHVVLYLLQEREYVENIITLEAELQSIYTFVSDVAQRVNAAKNPYLNTSLRELPPLTPEQDAEIKTYDSVWHSLLTEAARNGKSIKEVYERNKGIEAFM